MWQGVRRDSSKEEQRVKMSWKARQSVNKMVRDGRSSRRAGQPASLGFGNKARRPQTSVIKKAAAGRTPGEGPESSHGSSRGCDECPRPWKSPFHG